jgi:hypothetical protein
VQKRNSQAESLYPKNYSRNLLEQNANFEFPPPRASSCKQSVKSCFLTFPIWNLSVIEALWRRTSNGRHAKNRFSFRSNQVRLGVSLLAYNLGTCGGRWCCRPDWDSGQSKSVEIAGKTESCWRNRITAREFFVYLFRRSASLAASGAVRDRQDEQDEKTSQRRRLGCIVWPAQSANLEILANKEDANEI